MKFEEFVDKEKLIADTNAVFSECNTNPEQKKGIRLLIPIFHKYLLSTNSSKEEAFKIIEDDIWKFHRKGMPSWHDNDVLSDQRMHELYMCYCALFGLIPFENFQRTLEIYHKTNSDTKEIFGNLL